MTPKEKAEELVSKFMEFTPAEERYEYPYAVKCALIAVDEIIADYRSYRIKHWTTLEQALEMSEYWNEVKKEIDYVI